MLTGLGIDGDFTRADADGAASLLADILGSTLALAEATGTVSTSYAYEAFGGTTTTGAVSPSAFQYTGRENDGTELYYYRARYYHPGLTRFVSEDPLEFVGGDVNLYAYVWNDPVNYLDPTGEVPWVVGPILGGVLGGGLDLGIQLLLNGGDLNCGIGGT